MKVDGKTFFEVGTAHNSVVPIGFFLCGATKVVTADLHRRLDVGILKKSLAWMAENRDEVCGYYSGVANPQIAQITQINERMDLIDSLKLNPKKILSEANIVYMAPADAANTELPDASIDYHISTTVFEHIPRADIERILKEAKRILKKDGIAIHFIDLSDHFQHQDNSITRINFLRYSETSVKKMLRGKLTTSKDSPSVSIITPLYNSSKFVIDTVNSVLAQIWTDWEMIIVDDCSSDNSVEIVQGFVDQDSRIKIIRLAQNSGPAVARNTAIETAIGRYIAFLDSDDQWKPNKLEKQIKFMIDNNYSFTYTDYDVINEEGRFKGIVSAKPYVSYSDMLKNNYIGCLTAVYDRKKLGKMYMPILRKRQDWALWLSILKKVTKAYSLSESLSIYRDRPKSISSNKIEMFKYHWQLYRNVEKFSLVNSSFLLLRYLFYYFVRKLKYLR